MSVTLPPIVVLDGLDHEPRKPSSWLSRATVMTLLLIVGGPGLGQDVDDGRPHRSRDGLGHGREAVFPTVSGTMSAPSPAREFRQPAPVSGILGP